LLQDLLLFYPHHHLFFPAIQHQSGIASWP
jgi:hypothetical protein